MKNKILDAVMGCQKAACKLQESRSMQFIEDAARLIFAAFREGKKILIAGNGGSLCDAAHFAEELTGFFRSRERRALPAIALADPGHITCVANDQGFEQIFSRHLEALGQPGDIFVALTTSGASPDILRAVDTAGKMGLKTIAFLGKDGGKIRGLADLEWIVDGFQTSDRIQESHMAAIHVIVEMVEELLSSSSDGANRLRAFRGYGTKVSL